MGQPQCLSFSEHERRMRQGGPPSGRGYTATTPHKQAPLPPTALVRLSAALRRGRRVSEMFGVREAGLAKLR